MWNILGALWWKVADDRCHLFFYKSLLEVLELGIVVLTYVWELVDTLLGLLDFTEAAAPVEELCPMHAETMILKELIFLKNFE